MSGLPHLLALVFALLSVGACAGHQRRAGDPTRSLALVLPHACCQAPTTIGRLREALSKHTKLAHELVTTKRQPTVTKESVQQTIARVRQDYQSMRMKRAKKQLWRLLATARTSGAEGISAPQLAHAHLLLAAVAHAERQEAQMRKHVLAALALDERPQLDEDLFSPPVRAAIADVRPKLNKVRVTIAAVPAGAQVFWDGTLRGSTPLSLEGQLPGRHYLRVEHPLYEPLTRAPRLRRDQRIALRLRVARPPDIASAARENPALAPEATRLLGVDTLVWLSESPTALTLRVQPRHGDIRLLTLDASASSATIDRFALRVATATSRGATSLPVVPVAPATPAASASATGPSTRSRSGSHFRRYWWAWAIVGAVVVSTAVAVPAALSASADGRGVVLRLPP